MSMKRMHPYMAPEKPTKGPRKMYQFGYLKFLHEVRLKPFLPITYRLKYARDDNSSGQSLMGRVRYRNAKRIREREIEEWRAQNRVALA